MSKTFKKILIYIGIGILLFGAGFGTGRFIRLARISGTSSQLESGITSASESANSVADGLNTAAGLANSADSSGRAVEEGLGTMQQSTEQLRIFYDDIIRAVEADKEAEATFRELHSTSSNAAITALDIAIQHSEQYERLIQSLQQAIDNSSENSKKSE